MEPIKRKKRVIPNDVKIFVGHSMAVPKQIERILQNMGKKHSYLAHILGKKESEISKWMSGTHNFTFKTISKIEDKLGESIILCPYEYYRNIGTMITNYSISANNNSEILNKLPIVKAKILKADKDCIKVSFTPTTIQEKEISNLIVAPYGNCN